MTRCRSCRAPVIWALTERDKRMPLDAEPDPRGFFVLVPAKGLEPARVEHVGEGHTGERYTSHFATCPNAAQHRRSR